MSTKSQRIPYENLELELPEGYSTARILAYLGRDPRSLLQRVEGDRVRFAMAHGGGAARVGLTLERGLARAVLEIVEPATDADAEPWPAALETRVRRLLGLVVDPTAFERRAAGSPEIARLIDGQRGLVVPLAHDLTDAVLWVIVGQQVSLASAFSIRRALLERYGRPVGDGLVLLPTLERLAELEVDDLRAVRFSRRKAEYLVDLARATVSGDLDLEALRHTRPDAAEERLLAVRGLGPWSVNYFLMRGLGLADRVPIGDVALAKSLKRFFGLDERPGPDGVRELMAPFAPHRSLATFHLWHRLGNAP